LSLIQSHGHKTPSDYMKGRLTYSENERFNNRGNGINTSN